MASDIKLNDNGVVVEGGELHSAGPAGGSSFADRTKGNAQLYRREANTWKIIHRHADPLIEKIAATAVLQARE